MTVRSFAVIPATCERDIASISRRLSADPAEQDDLRQEMALCLLALPPNKNRSFYRKAIGMHVFNYWSRSIIDAPLGKNGRPILERRTVAVGGLNELARLAEAA